MTSFQRRYINGQEVLEIGVSPLSTREVRVRKGCEIALHSLERCSYCLVAATKHLTKATAPGQGQSITAGKAGGRPLVTLLSEARKQRETMLVLSLLSLSTQSESQPGMVGLPTSINFSG